MTWPERVLESSFSVISFTCMTFNRWQGLSSHDPGSKIIDWHQWALLYLACQQIACYAHCPSIVFQNQEPCCQLLSCDPKFWCEKQNTDGKPDCHRMKATWILPSYWALICLIHCIWSSTSWTLQGMTSKCSIFPSSIYANGKMGHAQLMAFGTIL